MSASQTELQKVHPIDTESLAAAKEMMRLSRPEGRDIAVFCSGNVPEEPIYTEHALQLGTLIGERGHNLVWGGTQAGTMQLMSDAAKEKGATLVAVSFAQEGEVSSNADVVLGAESLEQRKRTMLLLSDVAIALTGGVGTLGEIASVLEDKKGKSILAPLILVSTNGFYAELANQLATMEKYDLLPVPVEDMMRLTEDPRSAIRLAETVDVPVLNGFEP